MGLVTRPRDTFRRMRQYSRAEFPDAPLLFNGPFGNPPNFINTGESL